MKYRTSKYCVFITAILICGTLFAKKPVTFENKHIQKRLPSIKSIPTSSGIEDIDCIYYINLDIRPEKRKRLEEQFSYSELNATRVQGVNGWLLSRKAVKKLRGKHEYDPQLTRGAIGCALGHFSIWKDAYERDLERIWVMEDDVIFMNSPHTISGILAKLSAIDPDWDILYTDSDTRDWDGTYLRQTHLPPTNYPGVVDMGPDNYFFREEVAENIERINIRIGAYSLIISKSGLKKLLDFHKDKPIWTHADVSIHLVPGIRQYALKKPLATHTIQNRVSDTGTDPNL